MDQLDCCKWDVEIHQYSCCWCPDCLMEDMQELPFAGDLPCPMDNHAADLVEMIKQCDKAYSVILRLESIAATRPDMVSCRILPRIIKRQILFASLAIYDCKFLNYSGPRDCTCSNLQAAKQALKRLHDVCLIAGYDTQTIWSFLHYLPMPIHTVFY